MLLMTLSLILSCFFAVTTTQEVSPVQTDVGSDANFSFMLTEDPNTTFVNIQNKLGSVLSARGNTGISRHPFYMDRVNFTGNTYQKLISFILRNVTLVDAGIYIAILSATDKTIGSQMLIVKAAPSKPLIVELEAHALNGANYHLNCSAQSNSQPPDHNLSMFSEWRKDDMLIHSAGRYIVKGTELTINGVSYKEDNGSTLTCVAFEDQLPKSVNSDKFIMDVKYGPDNIQLNPSDGIITERENGKIIVNCTAHCNPPCSFKWTKYLVPTPLSNNQTLIINDVSKSDTGRYLCNVSNSITGISLTASINVMIIYGPVGAQISPSEFLFKFDETATLKITCLADCYPDCNFTWNGPPNFFQMGAQLSRIVDRDKGGNYTCTATNQNNFDKKATVSVMVIVLYGPGNSVNLGSIPPTLGVDLHQTAPDITCNATCNPPCDYHWYRNGTFLRNGAILSLGIVEKTTRGNYRCEAYTSVLGVNRSSSTSVNITVYDAPVVLLQPAVLTRPSVYILKLGQTNVGLTCVVIDANPPVQHFIWTKDGHELLTQTSSTFTITMVTKDTVGRWGCKAVNSKGNSLESTLDVDVHYGPIITNLPSITKVEGDDINVTCVVDSRPDPSSITWTKSQNNTFTQKKTEMYISHLNRADKGTYECTAVNTIQPTAETIGEIITVKSNYTLDVTCHPRTDFRLALETKIYRKHHEAVVLRYKVIAYPLPTFTWTFLGNSSESIGLPDSASQQNNGLQSELLFTSLGINDFGTYSVIADNSLPPLAREVFQIIPAVVPEIPSYIMIAEITQTCVTVEWVAGHNGGPQQIFHIIISAGSLTRTVNAADPGYRQRGTAVLDGLVPNTKYSINMIASNSVGSSNMTDTIIVTTLEVPGTSNGTSVVGITVGVSVGFLAILIVSIGIFLWRRHRPQQSDQGITLESDRIADIRPQDSDSYEKLHSDANRDIQMYSSLVMKNLSEDHQQCYENSQIQA